MAGDGICDRIPGHLVVGNEQAHHPVNVGRAWCHDDMESLAMPCSPVLAQQPIHLKHGSCGSQFPPNALDSALHQGPRFGATRQERFVNGGFINTAPTTSTRTSRCRNSSAPTPPYDPGGGVQEHPIRAKSAFGSGEDGFGVQDDKAALGQGEAMARRGTPGRLYAKPLVVLFLRDRGRGGCVGRGRGPRSVTRVAGLP